MDGSKHLFSPIPIISGFVVSGLYGVLSSLVMWYYCGSQNMKDYSTAYFLSFNSAISGGFVFATAFTVFYRQSYVPTILEKTFSIETLADTNYEKCKVDFNSKPKTVRFLAGFLVLSLWIFWMAQFPFAGLAQAFLITAGCLQYLAGVYVGRKIFHLSRMIQSVEHAPITEDVYIKDELSGIPPYVNYISILTAVTVYVAVKSYYTAHFSYQSIAGEAVRTFMLLPAVIAVPVLLFAYYPRVVIRRIYERAIDSIVASLESQPKKNEPSNFESKARAIEIRKTLYDELNARLRISLEDVPIVIVLGIAILSAIKG